MKSLSVFFRIQDLLRDLDTLGEWPEQVKQMQRNWIGKSEGAVFKFSLESNAWSFEGSRSSDVIYLVISHCSGVHNACGYHIWSVVRGSCTGAPSVAISSGSPMQEGGPNAQQG